MTEETPCPAEPKPPGPIRRHLNNVRDATKTFASTAIHHLFSPKTWLMGALFAVGLFTMGAFPAADIPMKFAFSLGLGTLFSAVVATVIDPCPHKAKDCGEHHGKEHAMEAAAHGQGHAHAQAHGHHAPEGTEVTTMQENAPQVAADINAQASVDFDQIHPGLPPGAQGVANNASGHYVG